MTNPVPTPAQLAQQAADAVKALIAVTMPHDCEYRFPANVYAVFRELSGLMSDLPTALESAHQWLEAQDAANRVGDDRGAPPSMEISDLGNLLGAAQESAKATGQVLAQMAEIASHLTRVTPPQAGA